MSHPKLPEAVNQIFQLRMNGDLEKVDELATELWEHWAANPTPEPDGLSEVCRIAFLAFLKGGERGQAYVWKARAQRVAIHQNAMNSIAMLQVPDAFKAAQRRQSPELGLLIMDEVVAGLVAEVKARGTEDLPGASLETLERAQLEKGAFFLWRSERYEEALARYRKAGEPTKKETRDRLRIEFGVKMCELGLGMPDISDPEGRALAATAFAHIADRAEQGKWEDVRLASANNVEKLRGDGQVGVQFLDTVEVED